MLLEEVKQILLKYEQKESNISELLQQKDSTKVLQLNAKEYPCSDDRVSIEEATKRNNAILRELETVKGSLRSKAIYSPCELQWDVICKRYQEAPSLPVTAWRCHVHVFV